MKRNPNVPEQPRQDLSAVDHHRCAWDSDGRRCNFPGTFTMSVLGSDRWYCHFHRGNKGEGIEGQRYAAMCVEKSRSMTVEQYLEVVMEKVYGKPAIEPIRKAA